MQSEELKPCPFCGGTDVHLRHHQANQTSWVSCVGCGLEAPSETGVSDEDAIAYWNRRAEAALSTDAEPVNPLGWVTIGAVKENSEYEYGMFCYKQQEDTPIAIYTTPPAPAVAVKALRLDTSKPGFDDFDKGWEACLDAISSLFSHPSYDKRIRSALSAQVQDVAGIETTTRFHIEWIAGARPPIHPNPMTGRTAFETFDRALRHMKSQADDAQFVSLHERQTTVVTVDRTADMRAMLAAAPAAKQGEAE